MLDPILGTILDPMLDFDLGRGLPLLADAALKSLFVSAAVLAALPLVRGASAATRHLVLLAGLGVLLGLPALMPLLPRQTLPHPAPLSPAADAPSPLPVDSPRAEPLDDRLSRAEPLGFGNATPRLRGHKEEQASSPAQVGARPSKARGFSPVGDDPPLIRPAWLALGWLLGVLACAGRMLTAQVRVWRLTRRCSSLSSTLLSAAGHDAGDFAACKTGPAGMPPLVWGWPRSVLLLPPDAAAWPPARLRAVLRHEAAHIRRRDWLTQTMAQAACALYWFNPLVWLLAARMNAEAERACDDAVLLSGVPPTDYAQDLLAVARSLNLGGAARRTSFGAVTMTRHSPVRGRLESILDTRRPRGRATRRAAALALTAALAVAAPLAALRPAARADEAPAGQAAPTAGVPTKADITRARQHLRDLEKARADYAAAHPSTLSLTQIGYLDGLREQTESKRAMEHVVAAEVAREKDAHARAKLLSVFKEHNAWATQVERNYRALVKPRIAAIPAAQVTREARMYSFDEAVALGKTRIEMMQMEHSLGYSLHIRPDDVARIAHAAFYWERTGRMSRADSIHVSLLQQKMQQRKRLDDADIDSLIVILHKPSQSPSISRSNVMFLFGRLPEASPAQREKIREAVTPFLRSRYKWERKDAEAVMKRLNSSTPSPVVIPSQKPSGEAAKNALRMQIIQTDKSLTALGRQVQAARTPAVAAFDRERQQRVEQTDADEDQIRSADAKSVLYPAQASHWKQVSANASARLQLRQKAIQTMHPPTREAEKEVARYDRCQTLFYAAMRRYIQLEALWGAKYAPRRAASTATSFSP